jgi:hypothetical protein
MGLKPGAFHLVAEIWCATASARVSCHKPAIFKIRLFVRENARGQSHSQGKETNSRNQNLIQAVSSDLMAVAGIGYISKET